jgi:23S rRNA (cytosine1962-C5)-methyltransferase
MDLPALYLRRHEERRVLAGHPWVYSNEVDVARSPLKDLAPGSPVQLRSARGQALGSAYANPSTLIAARLYSRDPATGLDRRLLEARLARALALRERVYPQPYYRLVYGESDGLPGLVVDRYGDLLVAQLGTAGIEAVRDMLLDTLDALLAPRVVVLRNDIPARALEGLPQEVEVVRGEAPEQWELEENGARFAFDPIHGHKTGWYLDHRHNRAALGPYVRDARVLDVFSYAGAWGVQAALGGARAVTCVDSSAGALEQAADNAARNGVGERVAGLQGDAFDMLRGLAEAGERYEVVILDPPAFIKRRKDEAAGLEAYRRLNALAARVVAPDGFLVTSSCSYRLGAAQLGDAAGRGARRAGRWLQILQQGGQGPDHPVHPHLPESAYLKCLTTRLSGGGAQ